MQLFLPDWGGWHTVVTAMTAEALETPMRLLRWQTRKAARLVDPDGRIVREELPGAPTAAEPLSGGPPQDAGAHG